MSKAKKTKTVTLEELVLCFPSVTRSECRRFLDSFPRSAKERLDACLEWRELHGLVADGGAGCPPDCDDSKDWEQASEAAVVDHMRRGVALSAASRSGRGGFRRSKVFGKQGKKAQLPSPLYGAGIPQLLYAHSTTSGDENRIEPLRDTTGHRVLHFLPALIDLAAFGPDSSAAATAFANALALYLHTKFDRRSRDFLEGGRRSERGARGEEDDDDDEQWTVVMDVRPGRGWPSPPAIQMLGFIRRAAQMLFELYPGRLWRYIVFPVPAVATRVWNAVTLFLDPSIAERIVVVSGPADLDSPVPVAKLLPYISRDGLERLEDARRAAFV
jgi:hypothetical protein